LAQGVEAPCRCFGERSARPLSWRTLARNVVFVAVALVALLAG
jgi:hypothetical protein